MLSCAVGQRDLRGRLRLERSTRRRLLIFTAGERREDEGQSGENESRSLHDPMLAQAAAMRARNPVFGPHAGGLIRPANLLAPLFTTC